MQFLPPGSSPVALKRAAGAHGGKPTNEELELFEEFWRRYPLKKGKAAALPAFVRALRTGRGTADGITAGAMAYAAERAGKDPSKTKYAEGWLNGAPPSQLR